MNPAQSADDVRTCIRCGVPLEFGRVPCPDTESYLKRGVSCDAMHWGDRCPKCGGQIYESARIDGNAGAS